jgi:hypothetical protein
MAEIPKLDIDENLQNPAEAGADLVVPTEQKLVKSLEAAKLLEDVERLLAGEIENKDFSGYKLMREEAVDALKYHKGQIKSGYLSSSRWLEGFVHDIDSLPIATEDSRQKEQKQKEERINNLCTDIDRLLGGEIDKKDFSDTHVVGLDDLKYILESFKKRIQGPDAEKYLYQIREFEDMVKRYDRLPLLSLKKEDVADTEDKLAEARSEAQDLYDEDADTFSANYIEDKQKIKLDLDRIANNKNVDEDVLILGDDNLSALSRIEDIIRRPLTHKEKAGLFLDKKSSFYEQRNKIRQEKEQNLTTREPDVILSDTVNKKQVGQKLEDWEAFEILQDADKEQGFSVKTPQEGLPEVLDDDEYIKKISQKNPIEEFDRLTSGQRDLSREATEKVMLESKKTGGKVMRASELIARDEIAIGIQQAWNNTSEEYRERIIKESGSESLAKKAFAKAIDRRRVQIESLLKEKLGEDFAFSREAFCNLLKDGYEADKITINEKKKIEVPKKSGEHISFFANDKKAFIKFIESREQAFNDEVERRTKNPGSAIEKAKEKFRNKRNEAGKNLVREAIMEDWIKKALIKLSKYLKRPATEADLLEGDDVHENFIDKIAGQNAKEEDKKAIREYLESKVNPKPEEPTEPKEPSVLPAPEISSAPVLPEVIENNSEDALLSDLYKPTGEIADKRKETGIFSDPSGETTTNANAKEDTVIVEGGKPGKINISSETKKNISDELSGELVRLNGTLPNLESVISDMVVKIYSGEAQDQDLESARRSLAETQARIENITALSTEINSQKDDSLPEEDVVLLLNSLPDSFERISLAQKLKGRNLQNEYASSKPKTKLEQEIELNNQIIKDEFEKFKKLHPQVKTKKQLSSELGSDLIINAQDGNEDLTVEDFFGVLQARSKEPVESIGGNAKDFYALLDAGYLPDSINEKGFFTRKIEIRRSIKKPDGSIEFKNVEMSEKDFKKLLDELRTDYNRKVLAMGVEDSQEFVNREVAKIVGEKEDQVPLMFERLKEKIAQAERIKKYVLDQEVFSPKSKKPTFRFKGIDSEGNVLIVGAKTKKQMKLPVIDFLLAQDKVKQ